ncbi:hypothetical protein CCACVL1_04486 [Corchorus capsularis]|uniref:Uncharacterized protein n=1 Tax=Corchorus capsularis TaxID=210143 RepID=A0A1R3JS57_COCAP|nr:hypothetical protein CCACVL1_04486 [Corchorus capsularis]
MAMIWTTSHAEFDLPMIWPARENKASAQAVWQIPRAT